MRGTGAAVTPDGRVAREGSAGDHPSTQNGATENRVDELPTVARLTRRSREASPSRLPRAPMTLVPRHRELSQIVDHVLRSEAALVTLVGPPGAGKTQLALMAADALADFFPDGVWFLDLTATRDAAHVLAAMAATLCMTDEAGQGLDETLELVEDGGLAADLERGPRPPLRHGIGMSFNAGASAGLAGGATEVQHPRLSEREMQIVQLISQGLTDRQIAARLRISPRTVDGHLRRIFAKVGAPSRAALAVWAVRRGVA